jgi:UDP-N-acetylmuramoyl-L-alanyl-D-glutamate--2,6-diaminopimelate ligase
MKLADLLSLFHRPVVSGPTDLEVHAVTADSRKCGPGVIFAAFQGETADGNDYVSQALDAGAVAVISEKAPPAGFTQSLAWIQVADARYALAKCAVALQDNPAGKMKLCGVTGTNGKTTTAFLVHHLMKKSWHRAGMLGTVRIDDGETVETAHSTTPSAVELQEILRRMADHACRGVAMEVSSHGIHQHRVTGIGFDACIFTNLTQDHLDYHGTMERYFAAKKAWFDALAADPLQKKPVAVINLDDAYGAELAESLQGKMPVWTFGFGVHCDFRMNNLRQSARGMEFELNHKGRQFLVRAPLIGRFNSYNIAGSLAAAAACGIPLRDSVPWMADAPQVPGRMENVGNAGGATVFVDYAHTPDALENACRTLLELEPTRLLTIFGCGGDRDARKRPLMGEVAARLSDYCVVTSDNPRSENPESIIREIVGGMGGSHHVTIIDRAKAIHDTIAATRAGDIVLIAGKGHETYQQFADRTIDFDDRREATKALRDRVVAAAKFRESLPPRKTHQPRRKERPE